MGRQMTEVASRGRALRARRRRCARRGLGLGELAFEFLEGEQELVGVELLGLLPEDRAPPLVEKMFEAPVLVGERGDLGAKRLNRRLLAREQRLQGRRKRCGIDRAEVRIHEEILSWNQRLSMR